MIDSRLQSCSKRIQFCYAHRLLNHEGKCHNLHGHNVTLLAQASRMSGSGPDGYYDPPMIVDFSDLKQILESAAMWMDHSTLIYDKDIELIKAMKSLSSKKIFVVPFETTIENIAFFLMYDIFPSLIDNGSNFEIHTIDLYESDNNFTTVKLDYFVLEKYRKWNEDLQQETEKELKYI